MTAITTRPTTATAAALSDLVIERVGFGLFVLDRSMTVLMWNRFMQDHTGIPAADVIGRNLFDCFPELPRAWLERKLESVFQLGSFAFSSWEQRPYLFRFEHDRPITGGVDYMQQDCTFMPLTRGREVEAVCVTISDVTHVSVMQREREEAVAKLREHANRDGLTGIANRRFFEARLGDEFARWQRYGGDLSMLLFDLDHFKTINDRFGHAAGDAVLRETARRVASIVRAQDTFGRFGGEEFALLLPCTNLDEAMRVADKVRDASATVGATAPDVLVNEADTALYRAKRLGRDRSIAYT
ncbi:GGDEF domain-containing protein [Burkholderia sp. B21-005]|uniref:GGDEF domain-containing protein n=1 Tax=Burkholderia sp. B21-005 TaxID=2890406 RepID=UPI001E474574|nr:diguanylate cyclase [Burkholderia sp. B21-005]UEP44293.1 diguanylate cyclase [Burkholderia sp. B21-005]